MFFGERRDNVTFIDVSKQKLMILFCKLMLARPMKECLRLLKSLKMN